MGLQLGCGGEGSGHEGGILGASDLDLPKASLAQQLYGDRGGGGLLGEVEPFSLAFFGLGTHGPAVQRVIDLVDPGQSCSHGLATRTLVRLDGQHGSSVGWSAFSLRQGDALQLLKRVRGGLGARTVVASWLFQLVELTVANATKTQPQPRPYRTRSTGSRGGCIVCRFLLFLRRLLGTSKVIPVSGRAAVVIVLTYLCRRWRVLRVGGAFRVREQER
jgi:hypothetical protein